MPLRAALRSQPTRAFLALRAAPLPRRTLVVLGIDTSCDDTSAAVVADDRRILSNVVRSQGAHHEAAGGIVPNVATQRHSAALPGAVSQALSEAGMTVDDVDMVAVTQGPGLAPCVAVGLNAAKTLAAVCKKPLVPVHHMEAHLLTARLCAERGAADVPFPFLCLLASGGHTLLVLAKGLGDYVRLGSALDDAIGEAFDKVARMLDLPWSVDGLACSPGAALEALAASGDPSRVFPPLPIPMRMKPQHRTHCDFSFAGLKTAVKLRVEDLGHDQSGRADLAAAFQVAAVTHITDRLDRGLEWCQPGSGRPWTAETAPHCLVLSGGVASNTALREAIASLGHDRAHRLELICPPPSLCRDNAVMIAWTAIEYAEAAKCRAVGKPTVAREDNEHPYEAQVRARWPLGDDYRDLEAADLEAAARELAPPTCRHHLPSCKLQTEN